MMMHRMNILILLQVLSCLILLCYLVLDRLSIAQRSLDIFLGMNDFIFFGICFYDIFHSDQTDPFNRNPLRMQDVIPQTELKQTIEEWKASRRREAS